MCLWKANLIISIYHALLHMTKCSHREQIRPFSSKTKADKSFSKESPQNTRRVDTGSSSTKALNYKSSPMVLDAVLMQIHQTLGHTLRFKNIKQ